ncbi:MBL fold metallo-hydrolase [Thermobifida halotolerans]|uniref:MBL fold metallo-hydrolase n=1 Tax=Thermobifida halotolerans TaxID=483545 RepID=UPI000B2F2392|nr:MBL fold metallo-hydrolase [Thermobifida halotolerans]
MGDHRLTYIPDGSVQLHPLAWFPDSTPEEWQKRPEYLDAEGFLAGSIGGLLVEYRDRALLIDTGYGPQHIPAALTHPALGVLEGGQLLDRLAAQGRTPETIDTVAFTHLHDDHVGWASVSSSDGSPLFADTPLVTSGAEWRSGGRLRAARTAPRGVSDGDEIFPGVTAWVTPGHSPGHTSYVISSAGARLVVFGDVMHSPAQVGRPDWRVSLDHSPETAVRTRLRVLKELSQPDTFGFGGHFADVVFGRVVADRSGDRWVPVD